VGTASVKRKEIINDTRTPLVVERKVTYGSISEFELREKFFALQKTGYIINESFSDDEWIVRNELKDAASHLHINKNMYKLKAFTLVYAENTDAKTLGKAIAFILKILKVSDNLKNQYIDTRKIGQSTAYFTHVFELYLDFAEEDVAENRIILERIVESEVNNNNSRKLPNYQSILLLDFLIERFISEDLDKNLKYYPIVLWWKLTMIIPMRPTEFFTLRKSDFHKDENGCFINIHRSKKSDPNNKDPHEIELIDFFKIDEKLYDLFIDYINKTEFFEAGEGYLFNAINVHTSSDREYIGTNVLQYLEIKFYDNFISEKYGYTIVKKETRTFLKDNEIEFINYGDTRHLAFLNLIISGYNPYTIAQLGGHRNLSTQFSYYSGLTAYCTSKAFSLAHGITKINSANALAMHDFQKKILAKENYDLSKARKIKDGYCICENYPYECFSVDCGNGMCEFFIPDNSENIAEEISIVQAEMNDKIELLKAIVYSEPNDSVIRSEAVGTLQEDIVKLARLYKNKIDMEEDNGRETNNNND